MATDARPRLRHRHVLPHRQYTRDRLSRTEDRLAALVHPDRAPVDEMSLSPAVERIDRAAAERLPYRAVALGEPLGPLFATYWLRVEATVPEAWAGSRVDVLLDTRSEATLWLGGRAVQGLNSAASQPRPDATLIGSAAGGERLRFEAEIACNDPFGYGERGQGTSGPYRTVPPFVLDACELLRFDPQAWGLSFDFAVLRALEAEEGVDPSLAGELLAGLNAFCNAWDEQDRATWDPAGRILTGLYARHAAGGPHELSAVGHAHLDTAWLWPLGETWRKAQRTFSTQVRLMDEYPEHVFAASQAQHYAWVKERDPALWDDIRERVARGQWVPVGGTWIEPDCNLPSGESLARQLLHGQRFFERELGRRCTELWQPDVFGYTGQLPQLMRQAGMSRFLTQKLSWNRFNPPEHHTFTWQGIDGSEVLTHFPPADTYNAEATVGELRRSLRAYRDHDRSRESLLVFGHGDGGGGPTRGMLERLRRARDLRGLPRTAIRHPDAFFDRLEADAGELRTIVGELYFEYHRGTYTTQAELKRGNRRCEAALHDAELLAAIAARLGRAAYPREALAEAWRVLLVNQFHDILPGTSITEVNERARRDLAGVEAAADDLAAAAIAALSGDGGPPAPVNTIGRPRREVVRDPQGALVLADAPPYGVGRIAEATAGERVRLERTADGGAVLENAHLRATLTPGGDVAGLVHLATGRQVLAAPGNRLELYEDRPNDWDAWDIDPYHLETRTDCAPAAGIAETRADPLRAEVVFERPVGERSLLRQVVRLDAGARRLEVHTTATWHEAHRLLKVAFPLAVHAHDATYEMAFGAARRPTHFSTRHDLARYEVPGHRWADLSEHGFGAALLTDSRYGYSAFGGTLRISLLRAPKQPDPTADMGEHVFAYAIVPHADGWQDGGVVGEARAFNAPLRWGAAARGGPWAEVDAPGLVLDTVKLAEDSEALLLRLYEAHGGRGRARIRLGLAFTRARRSNILEDDVGAMEIEGDTILLDFDPWEIVTLLVT
jgi:alpha-mannosidase